MSRIGVVTTSYPQHPGDPAGGFVAGHVAALRALGHHVDVIAAGAPGRDPQVSRVPSPLFARGGAPDQLERAPRRATLHAAAFALRFAARVARRAPAWDEIVAHWLVPAAIAAATSRRPLLAIAHGGDVHALRRAGLLAPVLHALHLRGARLAFVADELRDLAAAAAPRLAGWLARAQIQPMGIDLARFAALDRAPTTPPTVLVIARLVPIKGVDVALAALPALRARIPGARLAIAGGGPELARLRALATPGATLLGAVDTSHRDQLLRTASAVAIPSRRLANGRTEGAPTVAFEALAAGVPVVASALAGLRALPPAARLVPPDDPAALAAALADTLAAPPAADLLRAAVARLDWVTIATRLRNA